jgi:hypothetical protein
METVQFNGQKTVQMTEPLIATVIKLTIAINEN